VPALHALQRELSGRVAMLCVYIAEAHACDEWPIASARYNGGRGAVCVAAPRSDAARCALARAFVADFQFALPTLVDTVGEAPPDGDTKTRDPFDAAYAPWPLRFYGIAGDALGYVAHPKACSYDISELRTWALDAAAAREAGGV
jgi:hypothetical protein